MSYLRSQQPNKNVPKLMYDDHPDTRDQEHSYDQAIELALDPLSIMKHVKKGTLESSHMQHLMAMYPDVHDAIAKETTQQITQRHLDGEKPPKYKIRMGLSMLLGTPLDSTMTQQGIAAAQNVFKASKAVAQQQAQSKGKSSKASLSKLSAAYLTDDDARLAREQKISQG